MNLSTSMSLGTISHLSSSQHSRRSRCLEWDLFFFFISFFFWPWVCFHNHLLGDACNSRSGIQQEWSEVLSLLGDGFNSNECNSYGNKSV
jgi:hypothetical protein